MRKEMLNVTCHLNNIEDAFLLYQKEKI